MFLFFILTVLFLHLGFSSFNGKFAEAFAATFGVFFCVHVVCSDDFNVAVFWSDHYNPKLITHFRHVSMHPDILAFTNLIVQNVYVA